MRISSGIAGILLTLLVCYLLVCAYMFINQRKMLFFPGTADFDSCVHFSASQRIDANGTRLYYAQRSDTIAVVYHGNAGTACDRIWYDELFAKQNISTILVEYSGYAGSKEKISESAIYKNIDDTMRFLAGQNSSKIIVFGESLGTGPAARHALLQNASLLVLIAPYDRMSNIAGTRYPFLPVRLLLLDDFATTDYLKERTGKTLIIHGTADTTIPTRFGIHAFNLTTGDKQMILVPGAGHNDVEAREESLSAIRSALKNI